MRSVVSCFSSGCGRRLSEFLLLGRCVQPCNKSGLRFRRYLHAGDHITCDWNKLVPRLLTQEPVLLRQIMEPSILRAKKWNWFSNSGLSLQLWAENFKSQGIHFFEEKQETTLALQTGLACLGISLGPCPLANPVPPQHSPVKVQSYMLHGCWFNISFAAYKFYSFIF